MNTIPEPERQRFHAKMAAEYARLQRMKRAVDAANTGQGKRPEQNRNSELLAALAVIAGIATLMIYAYLTRN